MQPNSSDSDSTVQDTEEGSDAERFDAIGATTLEAVGEKASCVMECNCACNYAIGAAALWVLAMQSAYKSGPVSLPKSEEAGPPPMPERMAKALDAKGKVAAKAA